MRTRTLRQRRWIPLAQLLALPANSSMRADRNTADVFYAESWALTQMLIFSPAYAAGFSQLWDAAQSGASDAEMLAHVYGKPLSAITADLRNWIKRPRSGVSLPGIPNVNQHVEVSVLPGFESRLMLADLL